MDKETDNANILVDLDTILDTRHAALFLLDKQTSVDVLRGDYYKKRIKDTFGDIPYSVFSEFYKDRNKNILIISRQTPMLELVKEYCSDAYQSIITESLNRVPKLYVNVYPYILNEDESLTLLKMLYDNIDVKVEIELIYKSNEELTPKYIDTNVKILIKYDVLDWLELHTAIGNLSKFPILGVSCIGPLISNGDKTTKELTQEDFEEVRATFGHITNLILIQSRFFSLV